MRGLTARERVVGVRGAVAVGLAGLVLGGLGGFALHAATDHHHSFEGRPGQFGRPFDGGPHGFPGDRPQGPGGPGSVPPTTAPDDGTQPDQGGDTTSGANS
jgi:hypothetical protein